jgi:hypothetical protein
MNPSSRRALLLCAAAYGIALLLLPKGGMWVNDNANKYLQTVAALRHGYAAIDLPWPGRGIDPGFRFSPVPPPFGIVQGGKLYSQYPPYFAIASSLPFRLFGEWGLYLLPFLGGLLLLAALPALGRLLGLTRPGRAAALLLAGLGTPVWFYSVLFWEHTPAMALAAWGVYFCFRYPKSRRTRDLLLGAALTGAAVWLRDELYLFLPVLLAGILYQLREGRPRAVLLFGLAATAAVLPLWLLNLHYTGHVTGFHASSNVAWSGGLGGHLAGRGVAFYRLFVQLGARSELWLSLLLGVPIALLFLLRPPVCPQRFPWAVPVLVLFAIAALAYTLTGYLRTEDRLQYLMESNSLFSVSPLLVVGLLRRRPERDDPPEIQRTGRARTALWGVVLGYALLYALAAPMASTGGAHWGNRFLVVLYPFLALLAAATVQDWLALPPERTRRWAGALIVAAVASVAAQLFSMGLIVRVTDFSRQVNARAMAYPEQVLITDQPYISQMLYRPFYAKWVFLIERREEMDRLVGALVRAGVDRVRVLQSAKLAPEGSAPGEFEIIPDNGLNWCPIRVGTLRFVASGPPGDHRRDAETQRKPEEE